MGKKFVPGMAMFIVTLECFRYATGQEVPSIFADTLWVWWVIGVMWVLSLLEFIFRQRI